MKKAIQIQHDDIMERTFKAAADGGFEYVALGFGSSKAFHSDEWENEIDRIKSLLDKYNLKCIQTHAPYYHLLISSEESEEEMETAIKRCITATRMLGADRIALHPRSSVNHDFSKQKSFEDNRNYILDYLKTAEENNVIICVENMPLFPFDRLEWQFFGAYYEELIELCDSIKSDNVGICWDFGHAHTAKFDQVYALKQVGDRLKATHVHDNYRLGDHHLLPAQGSLEWGCIDWKTVTPVLGEIKYDGPLTLEIIYNNTPILESFIAHSYSCIDYLSKLVKE